MMHRLVCAALATGLVLTACSGDDADDSPTSIENSSSTTSTTSSPATAQPTPTSTQSPSTSSTTTTSPAPTTSGASTAPPSTEPESLEAVLQGLLDRYDAAVTAILTDPRVANDPAGPAVTTYLALFAPGSTFAQGALASWAQDAAAGHSYRPGPRGSMIDSSLVELTTVSDIEASFTMCSANSLEMVDASGNVIESSGGVTFVQATAERIDEEWLLRDLSLSGGDCPDPGPET